MEQTYSHPGEIVRAWREERRWSVQKLADKVGTFRQNIENLEGLVTRNPQFLPELAKVMGYASSDDLRALKPPPEVVNGELFEQAQSVSEFNTNLPASLDWEEVMQLEKRLPDEFVTVMPDEALAPKILSGTAIWFRAAKRANPRNVVLVEANGRRWIRRYIETADGPQAQALDDAFPSFVTFDVVAVMHMRADSSI